MNGGSIGFFIGAFSSFGIGSTLWLDAPLLFCFAVETASVLIGFFLGAAAQYFVREREK